MTFAEDLYKKELSFDEAEEEQEEILKKINELTKRIDPIAGSRKPKKINKDKMKNVFKNTEDIYLFRNKIINKIKKSKWREKV